jgi:hypothetical protein
VIIREYWTTTAEYYDLFIRTVWKMLSSGRASPPGSPVRCLKLAVVPYVSGSKSHAMEIVFVVSTNPMPSCSRRCEREHMLEGRASNGRSIAVSQPRCHLSRNAG